MSGTLPISGECDPRFARVREAFVANFTKHAERGVAVTIAIHGKPVVDLWGGYADVARTKPWQRDTIVNVFSVCKALNALAVLRLVEQGRVALDEPVAKLWPEFAAHGAVAPGGTAGIARAAARRIHARMAYDHARTCK